MTAPGQKGLDTFAKSIEMLTWVEFAIGKNFVHVKENSLRHDSVVL